VARGRLAIPLAVAAAVAAAQVAVVALRPREGVIEPAPVAARSYFSEAELARARDFRGPQAALGWGILAVEVGVLALLVARPPRRLTAVRRRPVLAAGLAGAALSVAVAVAPLPLKAVARERARDVGLVTRSWGGWAQDLAQTWAISAGVAGAGAAVAVAAIRRAPRWWWAPGALLVVGYGAVTQYVWPVVVDPLFNDFTELPDGRTKRDVLELARRADVDVGKVLVIDASRRTTAANAYVAGVGRTKRVVLYDTLLEGFTPEQVRYVVAHELSHVHHRDIPGGLLFLALVAPVGTFAISRVARAWDRGAAPGPQTVPALALAVVLVATPVTWVSNQLSRDVEARADAFALRLTDDPRTFITFKKDLAVRNVSDPDPPGWRNALLGTHPTTVERIGIGEAYAAGGR
jgi:STE24 endopeptidase